MKAVIMAGGKGTRLRPLTCDLPKPMVPLLGRPCMEYMIELLHTFGITDIAVTIQYMPEVIRNHFGDGSEFGVNLHYFEEHLPLGTAGSVKNAQDFLDERFIVISGDALTDFDLAKAIQFHENNDALATMVLTKVTYPLEYGVVMVDEDGRVTRFLEKPGWGEVFSDTVNTGIYILEPEVLERIQPGQPFDFSNDLFPSLLLEKKPLFGYVSTGYWSDIGNLQQYRETQFDMLDQRVNVKIKGKQIRPGIYVGEQVTFSDTVNWVGPAYIGDYTTLDDRVEIGEYCILGAHNTISKDSSIRKSILWNHTFLADQNELHGSTLGNRVTCKENAQFADGSVIGSHCFIGAKAMVQPNVKIWPNKQIRENTKLHTSMIWGNAVSKTLFTMHGVTGLPNIDISPEFAAKFACAYGSTLAKSKTLSVSCSADQFANIIKQSISAGLQSVGVNVVDFHAVLPEAARFGMKQFALSGGIHVQARSKNGQVQYSIECYDDKGLPLSRNQERKVENSYAQEDYSRSTVQQLGQYRAEPFVMDRYLQSMKSHLKHASMIKPCRIILVADPYIQQCIFQTLSTPHYDWISFHGNEERKENDRTALAECVRNNKADLGIWISSDGRSMQLVTEHGALLSQEQLIILQLLSFFHHQPQSTIGIPVSAPHILESLAEGLGGKVVRTKEHMRSILEVTPDMDFHPTHDAIFATGLLFDNLERAGTSLTQLLNMVPTRFYQREHIFCPWDSKGVIMRKMMEQSLGQRVDLLDGIKFYHDQDWALLLPDADEPLFNIITEAADPIKAETLAQQYRENILSYMH